jgi:CheY-like chemotaxis protein
VTARILLIEDNVDNHTLMGYLLEHAGHTVLIAEDGNEGVRTALAEQPDIVLLDLHMPGMDGYETAVVIGAQERLRGVPLVAVTAMAMVGDREAILRRGFTGYIPKPIRPESFAREVETYLAAAEAGA